MTRSALSLVRGLLAVSVFTAVGVQFVAQLAAGHDAVNFFSFFTNLSNLFAAAIFILLVAGIPRPAGSRAMVRGAAIFNLIIVGLVFAVLLRNVESDIIPWVNTLLHYVMPVYAVLDWCLDPPTTPLAYNRVIRTWLVFPMAFIAYTMIRGAIVHWYPYPFLNADTLGYRAVTLYCAVILIAGLAVAYVQMSAGNMLMRRRRFGS